MPLPEPMLIQFTANISSELVKCHVHMLKFHLIPVSKLYKAPKEPTWTWCISSNYWLKHAESLLLIHNSGCHFVLSFTWHFSLYFHCQKVCLLHFCQLICWKLTWRSLPTVIQDKVQKENCLRKCQSYPKCWSSLALLIFRLWMMSQLLTCWIVLKITNNIFTF